MNGNITNSTRDNGVRPVHKTNSRFDNEHFYYYDPNGLMNGIYYRADIYHTGNFATGRLNFTRDQSGLISTITQDLAMTVNYDPDLQISSIAHTLPQPFDESYTYDDNGNRLTSLTNSFIYDDLNRLTESTTHEYAYDADGNMTSERNKLTGESKKYYWDSESRMIKYEHLASDIAPVDTTALYKYDIYGRRIQKNVNDTITNFMWEGDNLSFELNATNQPIRKYFTEMGMDDYFAHVNYAEVTNWAYVLDTSYRQGWYGYIKDQVGTIYKVWDHNARAIADNRMYDSFGNLISQTGTTKTPLGFQGKYYDAESGLNYFYHRYYNPTLGRFISEDPIRFKGGLNFYSYVNSNPIRWTDKFGLSYLCFSRNKNKLRIYTQDGQLIGIFDASNNVSNGFDHFPFGIWNYTWHSPHTNAQPNDAISNSGIYIFDVPRGLFGGMGVHSGRLGESDGMGRCDWQYATEGCIRTTEDAMNTISEMFRLGDPITHIIVVSDEQCCDENN